MAGIPPIPPLLCNTPPPIDFGEEDDDSGLPPTLTLEDEDDYADFALGTDINEDTTNAEVSSLPRTPLQFELSSSTTSGFTDIPPALEDLGPISLNSSEFNNSTANQEVKTQTQLNEAFNYNVTQKFALDSDYTETTGTEGELKPINNSDAPSAQKFVTDCKQLDSDANEAKEKTTTSTTQTQPLSVAVILSEITAKPDSQIEDSDVAAKDLETEVKKDFMPTNSESPPPLPELVLLEDLDDDSSDEECHRSPKKSPISPTAPLEDHVDNDSEDFFAIHLVNTPPSPKEEKISTLADDINMNNSSNHNNNITNDLPKTENVNLNGREEQDDDFGDFADFETASNFINPPDNGGLVTTDLITTSVVDSNQNMRDLVEPPADTAIIAEDDDDFDDFQNFSSAPAPTPTPTVVPIISAPNSLSITVEHNNNNAQSAALKTGGVEENEFEANSFDNDDDDDFGDFEEASYETPATQITATTPAVQTPTKLSTQTTANGNIGDRLGTVLKIMFPTEEASPVDDDELQQAAKVNKINDTLPFEAIEAAKALEFQWPQSEMRHALIRSIGIDSRNILFGDNWNPSMPRFAANLSFNPLKPMKPQTTIAVPNTTYADADSMQYSINNSGSAAEPDMGNYAKKMDVPDVEFDWQGAGLVNPLDASHVHTLLLDLDQVMVMATKLDNLTVDSSSSSFSACATLEQIATTTTTTTITNNNTTANNNLIKQMQRLNLTPKTTNTTTTIITTPTWAATAQSCSLLSAPTSLSSSLPSSSSQSPSPSLLNNYNATICANSTHIFYPNAKQQHATNTYANVCTSQNLQTNALTHANAGRNALPPPNTNDSPPQTLVAHGPVGNINNTTVESFLYLNNFTNHFLAINQNHTTAMNNKITYNNDNNNKLSLNANSTIRFAMPNPKTTESSNATVKCADFCNNFIIPNKPLECVNFHSNPNRLLDCSRAKGETNARETEAVQPPPPVARLDTPDDEHQSHTTATNVGVNISETLSKNDNELTATPTRDACPSPLALDNAAYQFTTAESGINSISSSTSGSSINNSKPYDNSKTMTTLRLGANIVVDDDDETVVTSTYAGPLKETHIYTPSKTDVAITMKAGKAAVGGSEPIDFDYEIAAAGIIIDEKVVKKEYRDVEYNPGFSLEMVAEYTGELPMGAPSTLVSEPSAVSVQIPAQQQTTEFDTDEFTEFTEFQSVPPPPKATVPAADTHFGNSLSASTITSKFPAEINAKTTLNTLPAVLPAAVSKTKETSNTPSRTSSPSVVDNMILSPAILLPQAIPISTNNTATSKTTPTIEWGDSTANINPDELARIEELFAQPKIPAAAKDVNTSQKASPLHTYAEKHTKNNSISISASVALKEQDSTLNDDYWSEFVSVPVTPQLPTNASRLNNNNNNNNNSNNKSNNNNQLVITPKRITDVHINSANNSNNAMRSPRHQQPNINAQRTLTPTPQHKSTAHASANSAHISARSNAYNSNSNTNSNSNDDDWSDFVSSTPTPTSAATQQQHVASYMPATHAPQFNSAAWQNANFYNNPLGLYHQQAAIQTRTSPLTPQQQQLQLQQQIHIMQDFSTAPVTNRPQNALNNSNNANVNHMQQHSNTTYSPLQVGSARVAPSISLIPDLGFVAPALPVHTAFVNVLPKTSFNSKK
ncbi:serine-rich adhesin for platelets isoform X1 [Bactrocera neohumeralis]|uniref:serine-rich adhesin for platelets isoform X1 n=1 Tax=Bactrocera neohumeralis TaxID=98809 RepID=UPI002166546D|nr:serine-rich adhesin for platelets isoform X1 [Bactrocera neohumeralis]